MQGPETQNGCSVWADRLGPVEVRFVGRCGESEARLEPPRLLATLGETTIEASWAQQIHSAKVLEAAPGICGEGDALVSDQPGLALVVVTADCVPVLLAARQAGGQGRSALAAVHAGWRGLASGVIPQAVHRLGELAEIGAGELTAWIGPAIGRCCYEVETEVAEAVSVVAGGEAGLVHPGPRGRPHLDLQEAAARQLAAHGVEEVRRVEACTRCRHDLLHSYRRQGPGAGRNTALIWRQRPLL